MTTRPLAITALCLITAMSATLYAGWAEARGTGWNQVAADAAARAYAAEGKCYPSNGPCPPPPGTLNPDRSAHRYATQQHKRQSP
jgi:hypothetical protein